MMEAYRCKCCGKFILNNGYKNEHSEYFCDIICYRKYCCYHDYTPNIHNLYSVHEYIEKE